MSATAAPSGQGGTGKARERQGQRDRRRLVPLLGKRRKKDQRHRRTSSADLRFAFLLLVVAGIVIVLGGALVSQLRAAEWTEAMVSGAIILALVGVSLYSAIQRRRT
jgi:hypothetical protein